MKKLLIVLLAYGCGDFSGIEEEVSCIDSSVYVIEQDSILRLADQALEQIYIGEKNRQNMVAQIQEQLENKELTQLQIQQLTQQKDQFIVDLEEANKRKITEKDSIIYNIEYVDKEVYNEVTIPVYIYDTVHKEVVILDTVKVKKLKKSRSKK